MMHALDVVKLTCCYHHAVITCHCTTQLKLLTNATYTVQVLDSVRYDKIAAVRTAAAAAWAELKSLPDPITCEDTTPARTADKRASSSKRTAQAGSPAAKRVVGGQSLLHGET